MPDSNGALPHSKTMYGQEFAASRPGVQATEFSRLRVTRPVAAAARPKPPITLRQSRWGVYSSRRLIERGGVLECTLRDPYHARR